SKFRIGQGGPLRGVPVVRTDLKIGLTLTLIVRDWKKIFAARTHARSGLAAEDRLVWAGRVKLRVFGRMVVIALHIQCLAETIVTGLNFVASSGNRAGRILLVYDAG